jgi:hypothetical protein
MTRTLPSVPAAAWHAVAAAVRGFRTANKCSKAHKAHQRALQPNTDEP